MSPISAAVSADYPERVFHSRDPMPAADTKHNKNPEGTERSAPDFLNAYGRQRQCAGSDRLTAGRLYA